MNINRRRMFLDGGMGTMLQKAGFGKTDPMELNLTAPEAVREIHAAYLAAGSDIITANSFGAYSHKYLNAAEIAEAAVSNAKFPNALVALDMGPGGRLLKPLGDLAFDDAFRIFRETALAGARAGADLILLETFADLYELKAAVLAASETGLPIFATMSFNERGRSLTGADIKTTAVLLESLGVYALGMNCGFGPDAYAKLLPELRRATSLPIILQPNAGLPSVDERGEAAYGITPSDYARLMREMAGDAQILGGCCGTTPEHIAALINAVGREPREVCSGTKTVEIPVGYTPVFCEETDVDGIIEELLDLDDGEIKFARIADAEDVIKIQEIVRVPFGIYSSDPAVLERAAYLYDGRPLVFGAKINKYGAICFPG